MFTKINNTFVNILFWLSPLQEMTLYTKIDMKEFYVNLILLRKNYRNNMKKN